MFWIKDYGAYMTFYNVKLFVQYMYIFLKDHGFANADSL